MKPERLKAMQQDTAYDSPWSVGLRVKVGFWNVVWFSLFRPTPKYFFRWRILLLRWFGCRVSGRPFVDASAVIKMPWHLAMEDRACLGPKSEVYNLGPVTLKARCTVAQQAYLCAGTHDFSDPRLPLVVGEIVVGEDAFIGARALVLPGVRIGTRTVIGAGSVVTRDMPDDMICAGNPCRPIKPREMKAPRT